MERIPWRWTLTKILLCSWVIADRGQVTALIDLLMQSVCGDGGDFCCKSDPLMNPVYELRHGVDVVWQIPPNPIAVLFIAHGGEKEPLSFFDPGVNCTHCYGLPEDRAVVLAALQRSYAVILVKSVDISWQPFKFEEWPPPVTQDRLNVASILLDWTREHSLEDLPLAAFGHSAGGWFSTVLTVDLNIKSLILMCSNIEFEVMMHADQASFPPLLFMPMYNDAPFYVKITKSYETMKSLGIVTRVFEIYPRPISPQLFAGQIPCMDVDTAEKVHAAFKAEGWLDEGDFLIVNPRVFDWRSVLAKWDALPYCESRNDLLLAKHVEQELNAAFGQHSLTSWADEALFNWLHSTLFRAPNSSVGSSGVTAFS